MTRPIDWASLRAANLRRLSSAGFRIAGSLPVQGDPIALSPVREIAQRLCSLVVVFAWVAAPPDQVSDEDLRGRVARDGLDAFFGDDERGVLALRRDETHGDHVGQIGWKLENMWPLAWVLGLPREPAFDGAMVDDAVIDELLDFTSGRLGVDALLGRASPRSLAEVVSMEDLFFCAHNAARSAQLGHDTVPRGFHPVANGGVVHERRRALTWALSPGTAWDETDLST